ncbi:MAG: VPLPA-CTERM-specific exosortase XrtD [Methylobacter sp.]|nr:MAG: VPLPA-CTERM-specific exosortase XrtD [Methylobacter sp.]
MTSLSKDNSLIQLKKPPYILSVWIFALLLFGFTFKNSLEEMATVWINVEEYGHGFFIPVISIYLLWIRRRELKFVEQYKESLPGLSIVIVGLILFVLGGLATLKTIEQYAFIITVTGFFTVAFGLPGLRVGAIPLLFLIFMVPFPPFILNNLSSKLQLISSWLGVEFIRACDIMVYLEGNVIDLGGYKLQVVDACSGLRYLFPLASLSFLCAYLFRGPFWQKTLIFLSSAPLTIFMNSFRIGVIGIMVDNWGTKMAEGFLHEFEGWIIFLICMALLFIEMWLFSWISGKKVPLTELVLIPSEWSGNIKQADPEIKFNKSVFMLLLLLFSAAIASHYIQGREDIIPARKAFLNFPLHLGKWQGRNDYLSQTYLNDMKLTDYVIINYTQPESGSINFYSAYYQSQRKGVSVHSPKGCIPGDGWQITQFGQRNIPDIKLDNNVLQVNRAVIEKSGSRQLVYYWFQQRGRTITNEYLVKWYLFYDAIAMNRTDGSLIRLVTSVGEAEDLEVADQRLQSFMKDLMPEMPDYIPGKLFAEHIN